MVVNFSVVVTHAAFRDDEISWSIMGRWSDPKDITAVPFTGPGLAILLSG